MSNWQRLRKELILEAIHHEKSDIDKKDIASGKLHGTTYVKRNTSPRRGILLVHGVPGNRYGMGLLAERLAEYGYFCLSIDLPSHYLNPNAFTFGEISETITEGIVMLKRDYGIGSVAIVGHSVGALGALFSSAGYTAQVEAALYKFWSYIEELLEYCGKLYETQNFDVWPVLERIDEAYTKMKQTILYAMKNRIAQNADVAAYVLLAPPVSVKGVFPGISIFRKMPVRVGKVLFETLAHKPLVNLAYKQGNPAKYSPEPDPRYVNWLFFKTKEIREFLHYLTAAKEPKDFLRIIEDVVRFSHKDGMVSFFEYYQRRLLEKPKLFIYGKWDMFLRPFMPGAKNRLEQFYNSCGNAQIYYGTFSHLLTKEQAPAMALADFGVTELIIRFLENTGMQMQWRNSKGEEVRRRSFFGYFKLR